MVGREPLALLRRHVGRRSHDHAGLREARGLDPRDSEIGDLHLAARGQDDVGGLDIAMDHPARVRDVERQQELRHDRHDVRQVEAGLPVQVSAQARAFDEFHRDVGDVLVLAVLVDADDVGMVDPPGGARLVLEAADELRGEIGIDEVHPHRLDRDRALDVRIERLVDDAHRALAEDALDFVLAEFLELAHRRRAKPARARSAGGRGGFSFPASSSPGPGSSSSARARASACRSRRCCASGTRPPRGCRDSPRPRSRQAASRVV